ncbi:DUF748 domain-containing protein [Pseudomonas sp. No.21]|uniref:DUF748 domain-containing protein n=1 Tax=Pseudomonas TaxID=286 RepID=UPI000DA9AC85|nr:MULTISPECIES: DUF748 domain-containing protein [Pseudomonas]MDW3714423.1 DUF748 domain-containing protein [Pseudomonas sp. 2023EL-01195]PZE14435.1 hypothetical protein DMX10_05545 [Pseudomonas sp. 57B-090624]GJN48577.1 hypothetical protein TUM20249_45630 [Pseudomonas tohonis]
MHKGLKRAISALLIVIALYSLLGFLIIPGIALRVVNQQLAQYAKVPARLERIQLNPFSLELTLWGLHIGEAGKEQIGFQRLHANLQLDSLWTGALHLADVELEKSTTEVLFAKDGTLNLTQLFQIPPSEPKAEEPASDPFPLRIDSVRLVEGGLHFQDLRPSDAIEFVYDSLNLELKNLSTLRDDNTDMLLVATGPYGGRIDWQGSLSLVPFASKGELKVTDGNMKAFWPYVRDAVPLALEKGTISLATQYHLSLAQGTELKLEQTAIKVAPFAITAPDGRPLVNLESLEVSESSLDLAKQQVVVGKIRSQNLETWAAREADGQLDWQKLFAGDTKAPAKDTEPGPAAVDAKAVEPAPDAQPAQAKQEAPGKPWQVLLRDTQLRGYKVHLADRVPKKAVQIDLGPLNLDLKDFDSLGESPFQLAIDTGLGKQGKLKAEGQVQLKPTTANLKVETRDIDLRVAQAYMEPFVRLELRSGMLDSNLDVALTGTEPLALTVSGRALVNQLHTLDTLKERDFVKWQQLLVEGLAYRHGESLSIDKVGINQPYARFIINEDLTTNASDLVIKQPAAPNAKPEPAGKPLDIHVGAVSISNGSANFADFSLTPNFATAIQQLNGEIGTLDTRTRTPATVDIKGKVDRYAPVTIKGSLTPFDPLESLDIATSFKRVELTTLTPYSGKFAGYRIRKGRLNLDLHYQIEKGQLKAQNRLVLEQLQLGEQVDSPDAVDLPIKLAVALLKDTEGKIDIELPVAGNLKDPQFSVAPIVWQTLRNLVLRAAQAPFKFVAGLVSGGGDQDLSNVPFAAGSSELSTEAQGTLDTLAAALKERPALRLEVEGMSAKSSDGPLLAAQRLEREYQSTYYKIAQRRGDKVPAEPAQLVVPDDEKPPMLEGIYRTRLKQQPPAEWKDLGSDERTAKMREAVIGSWAQSELLLRQLAQARAASIKDYLVDRGGLQDERVYMLDVSLGEADADGKVDTPLQLGSE